MNTSTIVTCIGIGAASGVVAALCGVGGGIILVPAFVFFLGTTQKSAVTTSLAAIILTATAASLKNTGSQLVNWKVAILTGLSGALLAWFTADYLKQFSNLMLTRIFAVVLIAVGIKMLLNR